MTNSLDMKDMSDDKLLSQTISYLRFPLVVLVVFLHHNVGQGLIVGGAKMVDGANDILDFFITLVSDVLSNVGVPLFFMFSGFLFFYGGVFGHDIYFNKIKKRIKSLFFPYFTWNTLTLTFTLCLFLPFFSQLMPSIDELNINWSLKGFLNTYWNMDNGIVGHIHLPDERIYPIDQPLWYVRDLMIIILCSPIIYYMVKRLRYYWAVLLFILWQTIEPLKLGHINQLMTALLFFSWGATYSIQGLNFVTRFRKYNIIPFLYIVVAVVDAITKGFRFHIYVHDLGILLGIVSFVYVASLLIEREIIKPNAFLAGASFFVYAGHDIILNNVSKLLTRLWHVNSQWYLLANYIVVPIMVIIVFLGIYALIRKYTPKILVPLTGGR